MMRWMLFRDNRTVATSFERYAAIADLRRVLMSHGDPFYDRPSETLKAVAAGLRS
jgi:hypothetical protein